MDSQSKKADVEAQLRQTAEAMSGRLSSIQEEVESTGVSVRNWVANNPLKSVGGMLAAGLAVGMIFGGGRSRRRQAHDALIDEYLQALRAEVENAVEEGDEAGAALEKALRDRVPMVVYPQDGESSSGRGWTGVLGDGARIVFRTGLSLLARDVLESMLADANLDELTDGEALQE